MGQADRRGTFAERKAKAIIRNKKKVAKALEVAKQAEAELSAEEKQKRSHARIAMLSFMALGRRSGLSPKEFKRRVKRYNKKGV